MICETSIDAEKRLAHTIITDFETFNQLGETSIDAEKRLAQQ